MISVDIKNTRFNYRVAGILIYNGKLILEKDKYQGFWVLPGGRCEINEESSNTIKREFKEELSFDISTIKMISLNENFFSYNNQKFHEIGIYYTCEFLKKENIFIQENEFYGTENSSQYKWWSLDQINDIDFYPIEIKKIINSENILGIQHFVTKEITT